MLSLLSIKLLSNAISDVYHRFHLFPRLPPNTWFSDPHFFSCRFMCSQAIPYRFSRTCDLWHFFSRVMSPVTCFPLLFFPRLSTGTCFPALAFRYTFSRACCQLKVFSRLPPVTLFSRACYQSYTCFEF